MSFSTPESSSTAPSASSLDIDASEWVPTHPLIVIEPSRRWVPLDLRQLWRYRGLLYFLTWRDLKVRYKQTLLGAAWAVIQPLFTMFVFTIFFGRLAGIPSEGLPYPVFAYAGLLPWTFFSNAVTKAAGSLIQESRLISKVYFPRMLVPMTPVFAGLVDFGIALLVYFALVAWFGVGVSGQVIFLPLLIVQTALLAIAVGMLMASWNVRYRDLRQVLPFLIQIWLFVSPVIYPTSMVPEAWRWVLVLNPLTGIIDGFRGVLFPGHAVSVVALLVSAGITLILLIYGAFTFRKVERTLADII